MIACPVCRKPLGAGGRCDCPELPVEVSRATPSDYACFGIPIPRYTQATGGDMEQYDQGEWVRIEQLEAISADNARLRAQLTSASSALRALGYEPHGIGWAITVVEKPPAGVQ
jgi:hypothetical protein